ncbi:12-oxophytodienoate reductase (plasmid) [Sphingomonas paeninsulae]|uniref:12-oxophytodienoate reductase n=1 Tax=Sphingomonas paeninsulae TaxID=2319844 RepID=A0A494TIA6_SPHPE|nr:NADH:flavin oxidoreductase [Sphingomonas paeninsulae]AYJ85158.1 12-oxophytodienoate reductase [Sphingomonas paeninsulae]
MSLLEALETPFTLKSLRLKNRFAMSPMTRYFSPDGLPTQDVAAYYRRRAEGGVGLIISEGVGLDRVHSRAVSFVPNFCDDALSEWSKVVADVHAAGAAMAPQLWHVGGVADYNYPDAEHDPLESPSGLIGPDTPGGRVMSEEDVADTIASFARAAGDSNRLGFDCVEVHAAHGYLVDQFFWSETNRRDGRYGGTDLRARSNLAAEIVRAMRAAVGEDYVLMMRVSQWKTGYYDTKLASTPAEIEQWLGPLVEAGVDLIDCSQRRFWEPEFEGSDLNLAGWVKKMLGVPTMTVGSIGLDRDLFADFAGGTSAVNMRSLEELARRFDRGDFDLVALGRVLLSDPSWLQKVREGRLGELTPYSAEAMQTLY